MSKFRGMVGFVKFEEKDNKWNEKTIEYPYYGEIIKNARKLQAVNDQINNNVVIANDISIIANPYARENFQYIRYVVFMGTKWKVENVTVQYPRLLLSLGGIYNGQ